MVERAGTDPHMAVAAVADTALEEMAVTVLPGNQTEVEMAELAREAAEAITRITTAGAAVELLLSSTIFKEI